MGVIDTLKIVYAIDVEDHGTRQLLRSQHEIRKGVTQTGSVLARHDTQVRRTTASVVSSSRRGAAAFLHEARASRDMTRELDRQTRSLRSNNAAHVQADRVRRSAAANPGIVRRAAGTAAGSVRGAVGGIAAIASIATAKNAISVTEELAKATLALNKNLGLSVEQSSRWAAVAKTRGIDSKALSQTFGILSKNATAAAAGGKAQADAFERLGISQRELQHQDFDTTLGAVANGLAKLPAGAERTALSMKLFGRGWQTVVPLLRDGSKAMNEQLALADKYGVTFKGKTVKSLHELVAAQRESQMATMGLQVAFATAVIPTLTKVINKTSEFAAQMRSGEGAGGRFARQAKEVADDLRPVGEVLKSVGGFLVEHPHLVVAAAGAYIAFKAARGTIKVVNDLRAMRQAIIAVRNAAASTRIASAIAAGASGTGRLVRRSLAGVGTIVSRMMGTAGRRGGLVVAESIASNAGANMGPALDRHQKAFRGGRWATLGRFAGRAFGVAAAAMIAIEVAKSIPALNQYSGSKGWGEMWRDLKRRATGDPGRLRAPGAGRRGGVVSTSGGVVARARSYQHGGLVPIIASGGEVHVDGGHATMIPGPSGRDATPMMVRPGSAILTGDGQARMAAGASLHEAIAAQAPHFAKGGVVPGKYVATSYGPPWGGIQGTGVTRSGVNLKGNPRLYGIATDPRMIALGSKVFAHPNPFGYSGRFSAFDTGGAIKGRRIDFYDWRGRARQNAWGRRAVTISRSRIAPRQGGEDTYRAPGGGGSETNVAILGRSRRRSGLIGDAFAQGQSAGQAGLTRDDIRRTGNPVLQAIRDALAGSGTQPDKGGAATRFSAGDEAALGNLPAGSRIARMAAKASAIDARRYQYSWGGGHGRIGIPTVGSRTSRGGPRGLGYDCSGAVSAVLGAGGLLRSPVTSGGLMNWGKKGSSKNLAVYANPGHVIMRIGRRFFGTSETNPQGGAGWINSNTMKGRGVVRTIGLSPQPRRRPSTTSARPTGAGRMRPAFRAGGIVSPLQGLRVASHRPASAGGALTGGVRNAMSMAGGSLAALDEIIGRSVHERLIALRRQVERRVKQGGPKKVIDRLKSIISTIDFEIGRRVGRIQDTVEQRARQLDRRRGATERAQRRSGVNPDSPAGIGVMQTLQAHETAGRQSNVSRLQRALSQARAVGDKTAVRELTQQLQDARDELDESFTRQVELRRDALRAFGQAQVNTAQFGLGLAQTGMGAVEAQQRLSRTQDTPQGMRERAAYTQNAVIPALQATQNVARYNAELLASIGDLDGWRQAVQDAAAAGVDLANAQADAADLLREAAATAAQDRVDASTHGVTMADLAFQRLELEQQLIGTHDSTGGAQGRADFIRQQILPAIQAEINDLLLQQAQAQVDGNAILARQIGEAVAGEQNHLLQAQLDAQRETAENTDALKEFGGSTAFSYHDQLMNDADVIKARIGA